MAELSETTQKRISFLSVFETLGGDYDKAMEVIGLMEEDGLFDEPKPARSGGSGNRRSGGRSGSSTNRRSGSRSSNRGNRGGGDDSWRDDPATDKQIEKAIDVGAIEDGYSDADLEAMTKGEISDLIDSLK